ncbi:MAG: hypothetical protein AAFN77_12785 [Planctomycetota bacterium]
MSDSHNDQEAPRYDDINTPVVLLVGAISAVVTLITIFFVQGLCYHWQNSFLSSREAGPTSMPAYQQVEEQKSNLLSDENTTLNIEEAKTAVIAKYSK